MPKEWGCVSYAAGSLPLQEEQEIMTDNQAIDGAPRDASNFKLCPRCANIGRSDDCTECQGRVAWYSKPPNEAFTEWYCRNPYEELTNSTAAWMAFKAGRDHASVVVQSSMTTNQTIDGVPRELEPCPFCGGEADLKCTEGDYPDWFVQCTECHASVDVFGPGAVHHWNGRKLPAAQPQGEPVAWQYRVSAGPQTGWSLWHDGKGEEFKQSYQVETRPLYTEQPALVAVVQDFGDPYQGAREDLSVWKRRALESEAKVREQDQIIDRLVDAINAENGPTHMGEPSISQWKLPDPHGKQSNLKDTQYAMGWNAYLDEMKRLNPSL